MLHYTSCALAAAKCVFSVRFSAGIERSAENSNRRDFSVEDLKNSVSKAVGTKAVMRALKAGSAQRVYVARDIDTFLYQKVTRACEDAGVPIRRVDETKALGAACGLDIPCAAAAILK